MAAERRDPGLGAAPDLAARPGFAGRGGTLPGARPATRARRGQGHPRRVDHRRPGLAAASDQGRVPRRAGPVAGPGAMNAVSPSPEAPAPARAALTYPAEPGDAALGALLEICEPADVLAAIKADLLPGTGPGCGDSAASRKALERALARWRARLPGLPEDAGMAAPRGGELGPPQPRRHPADLPGRSRVARRAG